MTGPRPRRVRESPGSWCEVGTPGMLSLGSEGTELTALTSSLHEGLFMRKLLEILSSLKVKSTSLLECWLTPGE